MPLINQYSPGIPQVNVLVHAVNALTSESGFGQFIKHLEAVKCENCPINNIQFKKQTSLQFHKIACNMKKLDLNILQV